VATTNLSSPIAAALRFGVFELDLRQGQLFRAGAPARLSPQPLKLLVLLASRPGEIVTRTEIREQLWDSDTFVDFEQGVNHCIREIRFVLDDGARSPRFIQTLPRRGYRFIAPIATVETGALSAPALTVATPSPPDTLKDRARTWLAALKAESRAALSSFRSRRVRVAVLPFDNLSGDPRHQSLSDGLTEELTTRLSDGAGSRIHVICRRTAAAFKAAGHPILTARDEGVHYLLEGSFRRAGQRGRVSAQLVSVSDETQLWGESYEALLSNVLAFQREVATAIAAGARHRLSF
jgi:TolB-like protein/DNA-binding winged helix-turn-helix (wHTH) protein